MVTVQGLIIFKVALSCHIFPSELWDIYQENLNFLLIYSIELYSCIIQELYSVSLSCFICWRVRTFSKVSKNLISLPIPIFDQNPRLKILHCCIPGAYWIWVYGLMISRLFNILLHFKLFLSRLIMLFLWLWSVYVWGWQNDAIRPYPIRTLTPGICWSIDWKKERCDAQSDVWIGFVLKSEMFSKSIL